MSTSQLFRAADRQGTGAKARRWRGGKVVLVEDPHQPGRVVPRSGRSWARLVARLGGPWLDRRLAEGRSPESRRLLAVRAQHLVSPATRQSLARSWEDLLEEARRPSSVRRRQVPLCRHRITAAEPEVRAMLTALVAPVPLESQGVAMVSWLMADGAGPLYHRRCPTDLATALREASAKLEPLSGASL